MPHKSSSNCGLPVRLILVLKVAIINPIRVGDGPSHSAQPGYGETIPVLGSQEMQGQVPAQVKSVQKSTAMSKASCQVTQLGEQERLSLDLLVTVTLVCLCSHCLMFCCPPITQLLLGATFWRVSQLREVPFLTALTVGSVI